MFVVVSWLSARESIYITRDDSIYRSYNVFHGRSPFVSPVCAPIIPRTSLFLSYAFSLLRPHAKGVCIANTRGQLYAIWFLSRAVIITTKSHCNRTTRQRNTIRNNVNPSQTTVTNNIAHDGGSWDRRSMRFPVKSNEGGSQLRLISEHAKKKACRNFTPFFLNNIILWIFE